MKIKSFRKILYGAAATILSGTMVFSAVLPGFSVSPDVASAETERKGTFNNVSGKIGFDSKEYLASSVAQKLPETVDNDQEISVLVYSSADTVLDAYDALGATKLSYGDFASSAEGRAASDRIERENRVLKNRLTNAGIPFETGFSYDTLLSGFEVVIKAGDFDKLCNALGKDAGAMVSEVYAEAETEVVTNDVKVDTTGIFDSSDSDYDGSGTVVAILDTGLDYTHPAFDPANFSGEQLITTQTLSQKIGDLAAARMTPGLTPVSVYRSPKVPYAYDYADQDAEVFPINGDHGTHVAGIVAGKDEVIRGVAPNAQLAIMKVFSESQSGARQSWIVAALEDCVTLGVDVINMSLGTSCGFSREVDDVARQAVYDSVKEHGISLVAAASNDYNSTFGSEKNGNLGLTTNPDSSTVGAPSTYDAALSVASISGVKTPYLLFNDEIIYFHEASDRAAKALNFVNTILGADETEHEYEYVVIGGVGREVDYADYAYADLEGKIALVKRGQTNFEEKARIAQAHGAAGCIIYNNVSGDISMTIGEVVNYPVCSVSQVDGEKLISAPESQRKLVVSRDQQAGPFMSDFSSWGPSPDLGIKPEITAHGGEILSAIPGGRYDRYSGTSMACPNQAGVTALVREYVKDTFNLKAEDSATRLQVTALVNQIMMSTTDIAYNTNGLPFAVRKQGAGLANLDKATSSPAYLRTYDRAGENNIDKAKIELGDDPQKTGVYTFKFDLVNIKSGSLSYEVGAVVMTEGYSDVLTLKGDRTVTEKGYELSGATITVNSVTGGSFDGNTVTVDGNGTATIEATITLSEEDKAYLDQYKEDANGNRKYIFANGMYVEGFVKLSPKEGAGAVSLNVPYLAFYGDWTQAPLFDLDYFETSVSELDDSIDAQDKVMPDAFATRPVGGLYDDYIVMLGSYVFNREPGSSIVIAADREHIALTNQTGATGGVSSIRNVYAGLLRNAKRMLITITDNVTGEVVYERTEWNKQKSYNYGGAISSSMVDVEFNLRDYDLKNNTHYTVKLTGLLDYGEDGGLSTNLRNTFEFPFYTDFTAPVITDVRYTYEYDADARKNKLYANVDIYDNHYVQAIMPGYISYNKDYNPDEADSYQYVLNGFDRYMTPVIGGRNTTNTVRIELTDYLEKIKTDSYNGRSFLIQAYDYAMNVSTYELPIPDEVAEIAFTEEEIRISPNETYPLRPQVLPQDRAWAETLNYTVLANGEESEEYARVVNGKLVGVKSTPDDVELTLVARSNYDPEIFTEIGVVVLKEGDEGYHKYDRPVADSFRVTGYLVNKVFYDMDPSQGLGADEAGDEVYFTGNGTQYLSMYPSESVTFRYELQGYFDPSLYQVQYTTSNANTVSVDPDGTIVAKNLDANGNYSNYERSATISVRLCMWDEATQTYRNTPYSQTISITVKQAYATNGPYLTSYRGLGGVVSIPRSFGLTEISQYAFSNYQWIPKDLSAGDEITEEDPYYSKMWYIGDHTITEVVIPEGVITIGPYAFAGLTALTKVTLPSTLTKIQGGAFYGCTSLQTVEFSGANNLQFVNEYGFFGCANLSNIDFDSIIAVGDYAFTGCNLKELTLPATAQSIASYAFAANTSLSSLTIQAQSVKVGEYAFTRCTALRRAEINASELPAGVFLDCENLSTIRIGKDVSVLGQFLFTGTAVNNVTVDNANPYLQSKSNYIIERETGKLVFVSPTVTNFSPSDNSITEIGTGAFTAVRNLTSVSLPRVTTIGDYAFADCSTLTRASFGSLTSIGNYAFRGTRISALPRIAAGATIGEGAFLGGYGYSSQGGVTFVSPTFTEVDLPANVKIGANAFGYNDRIRSVEIGDNATIGDRAFYTTLNLASVEIGDNATIGEGAFAANSSLFYGYRVSTGETIPIQDEVYDIYGDFPISAITSVTIGTNAKIGANAFRGAGSGSLTTGIGGNLTTVNLGAGATIGAYAFYNCYMLENIDLSGVKPLVDETTGEILAPAIGAYAFSGFVDGYILFENEIESVGQMYFPTGVTDVNLTSADSVGEGAFLNVYSIENLTFGPEFESIGASAFGLEMSFNADLDGDGEDDIDLSEAIPLGNVDLTNVKTIGADAFNGRVTLKTATFGDGADIGASAFEGCSALATLGNLSNVYSIGEGAFRGTAVTQADLTNVVRLGDFAFENSKLGTVTLGEALEFLGENPFVNCDVKKFSDREGTYDLNDRIRVIDDVLYRTAAGGGLELISYPLGKADPQFVIAAGTVRVGAKSFANNRRLAVVEFDRKVGAIGDRAFYGCETLTAVVFRSVEAPILEEQYDYEYDNGYVTDENGETVPLYAMNALGYLYYSGEDENGEPVEVRFGLGIVPYRMWGYGPENVFFGASFYAEIGTKAGLAAHEAKTLVMVRPVNGTGYDNYLYSRYFDAIIDGAPALYDETVEIIALIDALPSTLDITLDYEAQVAAIRARYDALTVEQKSLVGNIRTLEEIEETIAYLKSLQPQPPQSEEPKESKGFPAWAVGLCVGVGSAVAILLIAGAVAWFVIRNLTRKASENSETESETETPEAENSEMGKPEAEQPESKDTEENDKSE